MARPKKQRNLCCQPDATHYDPRGVELDQLEEVLLDHEEYVAMLHVYEHGHSQTEAAGLMHISQPTLSRILSRGLKKTVHALASGKALVIEKT
ncbi:MAG: hypothetical protein TR69_WS6001001345 [candidate division WS6 bacterium OLB20]|uniref:Uncharacterized protein n=1 Tax=candidate division WS6 bacterium OLB20 TaxID=1617426 RepID=A0A136LWL4_9BACT|nr:MAG: hypothetical protein TR69_WS6001001345 [candidate division WS6 bacterium OLB20]